MTQKTDIIADEIYDILVKYCKAIEGQNERLQFSLWLEKHEHSGEYRFMGSLGFGGKFWINNGKWYVNCYPEDETKERKKTILLTNVQLKNLQHNLAIDDLIEEVEDNEYAIFHVMQKYNLYLVPSGTEEWYVGNWNEVYKYKDQQMGVIESTPYAAVIKYLNDKRRIRTKEI